jgi:hypothetical protein
MQFTQGNSYVVTYADEIAGVDENSRPVTLKKKNATSLEYEGTSTSGDPQKPPKEGFTYISGTSTCHVFLTTTAAEKLGPAP